MIIISVDCGIGNAAKFFLRRKSGALLLYRNYKKIRSFGWFRMSLCFVGRCKE